MDSISGRLSRWTGQDRTGQDRADRTGQKGWIDGGDGMDGRMGGGMQERMDGWMHACIDG